MCPCLGLCSSHSSVRTKNSLLGVNVCQHGSQSGSRSHQTQAWVLELFLFSIPPAWHPQLRKGCSFFKRKMRSYFPLSLAQRRFSEWELSAPNDGMGVFNHSISLCFLLIFYPFRFIFNGSDTLVYNNKQQTCGHNESVSGSSVFNNLAARKRPEPRSGETR